MVLFYSRRSQPCSEDAIALILSSLLWKVTIIVVLGCLQNTLIISNYFKFYFAYKSCSTPCSYNLAWLSFLLIKRTGLNNACLFFYQIVPSVPKLYLKDLKYSAKKEHCEVLSQPCVEMYMLRFI